MQVFPDFRPSQTTVYLNRLSFFGSMGKSPTITGTVYCLPSMELPSSMAEMHPSQSFSATSYSIFITFKSTHLPADPDQVPLYRLIWQEGLACYVSSQLNPSAPLHDIVF